MKHAGALLAVLAAALVTFLLFKGVPWVVVLVLAGLLYLALFAVKLWRRRR